MDPWPSRILLNKPSLPSWATPVLDPLEALQIFADVVKEFDSDSDTQSQDHTPNQDPNEKDFDTVSQVFTELEFNQKPPGLVYITSFLKTKSAMKFRASRSPEDDAISYISTIEEDEDATAQAQSNGARMVTIFQKIDPPSPYFTGREQVIQRLHALMTHASTKSKVTDRTIVLYGIAGIGKSEIARMYADIYIDDPIIQNVAWMDAENDYSLKQSFISLAKRLGLAIAATTTGKINVDLLVKDVYAHFSTHVRKGLFIFDDAKTGASFILQRYLPPQNLKARPLLLITSTDKNWGEDVGIVGPKENLIPVDTLSKDESLKYIEKRINKGEEGLIQTNNAGEMQGILNFARSLQGYPLALSLASSIIKSSPAGILPEIQRYLRHMEVPKGKWVHDGHAPFAPKKYTQILRNVLTLSIDKMCISPEFPDDEGEMASHILNLMAYLPSDIIVMDSVRQIYRFLYNKSVPKKCFYILENFGLISIYKERSFEGPQQQKSRHRIKIHSKLQGLVRQRLDSSHNNNESNKYFYLFGICKCITHSLYNRDPNFAYPTMTLHRHLKGLNWPLNSLQYSIIFIGQLIQCRNDVASAWEVTTDVYSYLETRQSEKNVLIGNFNFLLYSCLFYFRSKKNRAYAEHRIFKATELSKTNLERMFVSILGLYFRHLLVFEGREEGGRSQSGSSYLNSYKGSHRRPSYSYSDRGESGNQSMTYLAEEYSYQVCFSLIKERFGKLKKALQDEIGGVLLSSVNLSIGGRLESVKELYCLLWHYFDSNKDAYCRQQCVQGICKIHNQLYPNLDHDSFDKLRVYWDDIRPFPYLEIWKNMIEPKDPNSKRNRGSVFTDSFFENGGPQILVQHLEFLSTPSAISLNDAGLLDFILVLAFDCQSASKLAQTPKFMETFHIFTTRIFELSHENIHQYQVSSLTTWFAFFSKNESLPDNRGIEWSMKSVANELNEFLLQLKTDRETISWSFITSDKRKEILEKFLRASVGDRGSVAVHTATIMMELV